MANIGKIGTKVMSGLNHASLSKYANNPEIYIKDTQISRRKDWFGGCVTHDHDRE